MIVVLVNKANIDNVITVCYYKALFLTLFCFVSMLFKEAKMSLFVAMKICQASVTEY